MVESSTIFDLAELGFKERKHDENHLAALAYAGNQPESAHRSGFDEFLVEEGIFEQVQARALKRALAEQLEAGLLAAKLTKIRMAEQMKSSRAQLNILPELSASLNSPPGDVARFDLPSASKGPGQPEMERTT